MRGTIILSEHRSGTNWLGGLAESTGRLGKSEEWLSRGMSKLDVKAHDRDDFLNRVVAMASTPNGYFMMKIFPWQQFLFYRHYGVDPIPLLRATHAVQFVLLERRDVLGQAISLAKARQSKSWVAGSGDENALRYDFGEICRAYFHVRRTYDFWRGYNDLHGLEALNFHYEDLLPDGMAFIEAVASHAGVGDLPEPTPRHSIQRNSETEFWREHFLEDLEKQGVLPHALPIQKPFGRLSNYMRLARGEYLKPFPLSY